MAVRALPTIRKFYNQEHTPLIRFFKKKMRGRLPPPENGVDSPSRVS
jgi:hypothetical protein